MEKKCNSTQIESQEKVVDITRIVGRDGMVPFPNYKAGIFLSLYYQDTCCLGRQKNGFTPAHCFIYPDVWQKSELIQHFYSMILKNLY